MNERTSTASKNEGWSPFDHPPSALRSFSATPGFVRGFCATCGGFLFWMKDNSSLVYLSVGNIDPIFLVGRSDDGEVGTVDVGGQRVPEGGYGLVLAGGYGRNFWCSNEMTGVTDNLVTVGVGRGKRWPQD